MNDFQKTSSEETSSKNKIIKAVFFCCIAIFAIVAGVPLLINELYKCNAGYVTMWGAADALSYYGNVLNGCITTGTVTATILFTYWQIKRDRYLEKNLSTWKQVDDIVTDALIDISPYKLIHINAAVPNRKAALREWHIAVAEYNLNVATALTMLSTHIDLNKESELASYIKLFQEVAIDYLGLGKKLEKLLSKERDKKIQNIECLVSDEMVSIIDEMCEKYNSSYKTLLNEKRKVFETIYQNIEDEANHISL